MSILERFKLSDKVAIVTGSGRGIGRGIALAFAEAGADVVCSGAPRQSDLDATAAAVVERGQRGLAVFCDVTEHEQLEHLVDRTLAEFGRIDLLVNNAGGAIPTAALQTTEEYFELVLRLNLSSAFLLSTLLAPKMVATAGGGAIVNISSRASQVAMQSFVAYGAAKAGMNMMTRNLALEFAPKVRVNVISVGAIGTDALSVVLTNDAIRQQLLSGTPMGRVGQVEDIAAGALYLCSPAASWVTGKILPIDGGVETTAISSPTEPL